MIETRSQRRQAYEQQRPSYPQVPSNTTSTSASSSAFNSASSLDFVSASSSASSSVPSSVNMPQQAFASAPLPSPSTAQRQNYFGSMASHGPTSHPEQQAPQQHRFAANQQFAGQRGDGAGAPETAPFLQDFNLVAEAAKRAQMACLMRDLGDVEL